LKGRVKITWGGRILSGVGWSGQLENAGLLCGGGGLRWEEGPVATAAMKGKRPGRGKAPLFNSKRMR